MDAYTTKRATAVDALIGRRIRETRLQVNISQNMLANAIGVSFQQVQKYERGKNRVGAARLLQIAKVLGVHYSKLFEAAPAPGPQPKKKARRKANEHAA